MITPVDNPKPKAKRRPSPQQVKVVNALVENGGSMADAMREAGYSEAYVKNPQKLKATTSFRDLLDLVDDSELLKQARSIALDGEDKRASLQAIDMLLKLKDRYPAGKLKVQEYQEEIENLAE